MLCVPKAMCFIWIFIIIYDFDEYWLILMNNDDYINMYDYLWILMNIDEYWLNFDAFVLFQSPLMAGYSKWACYELMLFVPMTLIYICIIYIFIIIYVLILYVFNIGYTQHIILFWNDEKEEISLKAPANWYKLLRTPYFFKCSEKGADHTQW